MTKRLLVIGSGPVAQVLANLLNGEYDVAMACRSRPQLEARAARIELRRRSREPEVRPANATDLDSAGTEWDIVISTAPVTNPGIRDFIGGLPRRTIVASVSQVPSELTLLKQLVDEQRWALATPGFLAFTSGGVVQWWSPPGAAMITVAGPARDQVRSAFKDSQVARTGSEYSVMSAAAALMPVVAVLQSGRFQRWPSIRSLQIASSASNQARTIVAAAYGARRPIPMVAPVAGLVLAALAVATPFDFGRYCRDHFGSHTTQTRLMLDDWIATGESFGLETRILTRVRDQLGSGDAC